jgi:hypothetical protein
MKFGTGNFYENLYRNPEFGENRTKIPGTLREDLRVHHTVGRDISSETIHRMHGCDSMATLAIFTTLGIATCVGQRYNGNSQLRFHGNSAYTPHVTLYVHCLPCFCGRNEIGITAKQSS